MLKHMNESMYKKTIFVQSKIIKNINKISSHYKEKHIVWEGCVSEYVFVKLDD